jgi:hypothetical protein
MYNSDPGMKMIGLILLLFLLIGGSWAWQAMTASTRHAHANELAEQWKHRRSACPNARSLLPGEVIAYRSAAHLLRREAQRVMLTESLRARA